MDNSLINIAQQLKATNSKVQLVYAFNGTGKTRLSRTFKELITPKYDENTETSSELTSKKIIYYSAFTEDLFYWDNDFERGTQHKLMIQPNAFTKWVLEEQGQDQNIIEYFQRYTNDKLTPRFNEEFSEVTFSLEGGNAESIKNLKISKGEESNFVWSIFFSLLELIISTLNDIQPDYPESTPFDNIDYIFIDDPVSSLDDNHLIQLAVDLAQLIKRNNSQIKFIVTTHNPLFYNVLYNEFNSKDTNPIYHWKPAHFKKYRLDKHQDGTLSLVDQLNDSPFSYHLYLISQLESVIDSGQVEKYHFNLLRNILEKTATFLGYKRWELLLPKTNDDLPNAYAKRIVNFSSHSKHAAEEVNTLKPEEKKMLGMLLKHLIDQHHFYRNESHE